MLKLNINVPNTTSNGTCSNNDVNIMLKQMQMMGETINAVHFMNSLVKNLSVVEAEEKIESYKLALMNLKAKGVL